MKLRFFVLIFTMSLFIPSCTLFQQAIPTQTSTPTYTFTPTAVPTATVTLTPEPTYDLCPNIEDFRDCFILEEELLDGSYWNWLNEMVAPTLLEDFKVREDQIRDDIPIVTVGLTSSAAFFYPGDNGVYEDEETTAPWNRKVTFAATETFDPVTNSTLEYLVLPVFYYDKETQQVFPVVTVQPLFREEQTEELMDIYLNSMNMPIIVFSSIPGGAFEKETTVMNDDVCPLSTKSYIKMGQEEWWQRTKRFFEGDYSAYSSPNMVVRGTVSSGELFQ